MRIIDVMHDSQRDRIKKTRIFEMKILVFFILFWFTSSEKHFFETIDKIDSFGLGKAERR